MSQPDISISAWRAGLDEWPTSGLQVPGSLRHSHAYPDPRIRQASFQASLHHGYFVTLQFRMASNSLFAVDSFF
jgi:hypothetical protein